MFLWNLKSKVKRQQLVLPSTIHLETPPANIEDSIFFSDKTLQKAHFSYDKGKFKVYIMPIIPHTAGTYPGFFTTRRLGAFLLVPGWDASPSQDYLPSSPRSNTFASTHTYAWVERGTVRVTCLAREHNTMSPAGTRIRTTRFGVQPANDYLTAPSYFSSGPCTIPEC